MAIINASCLEHIDFSKMHQSPTVSVMGNAKKRGGGEEGQEMLKLEECVRVYLNVNVCKPAQDLCGMFSFQIHSDSSKNFGLFLCKMKDF